MRIAVAEGIDQRVRREEITDGLAEGTAPLAVNDPHRGEAGEERVVQVLLQAVSGKGPGVSVECSPLK